MFLKVINPVRLNSQSTALAISSTRILQFCTASWDLFEYHPELLDYFGKIVVKGRCVAGRIDGYGFVETLEGRGEQGELRGNDRDVTNGAIMTHLS